MNTHERLGRDQLVCSAALLSQTDFLWSRYLPMVQFKHLKFVIGYLWAKIIIRKYINIGIFNMKIHIIVAPKLFFYMYFEGKVKTSFCIENLPFYNWFNISLKLNFTFLTLYSLSGIVDWDNPRSAKEMAMWSNLKKREQLKFCYHIGNIRASPHSEHIFKNRGN